MKIMNAFRDYVKEAQKLDLVVSEADFVTAVIQDLLSKHQNISEEIILTDLEKGLKNLKEMVKQKESENNEGAA